MSEIEAGFNDDYFMEHIAMTVLAKTVIINLASIIPFAKIWPTRDIAAGLRDSQS